MTLADLTDRNAVLQAVTECNSLGRDRFLAKYGYGRAYNYFLEIDGQRFDSKAIVGVAHRYQFPDLGPLGAHDFSGGLATVKRKLDELGFNVLVLSDAGHIGSYWWQDRQGERFWVEIRRSAEGLGTELRCPLADEAGGTNAWYDLLDGLNDDDVVYHWNAEQGRFVGRSVVAGRRAIDIQSGERVVPLERFIPLTVEVGLDRIRASMRQLEAARRDLQGHYPAATLYLPFQFRSDGLRMMSNYFTKLPASMRGILFGEDGLAEKDLPDPPPEDGHPLEPESEGRPGGFLRPFRPRADAEYVARVAGGRFRRGRTHETLVNGFAKWLQSNGLAVGSNAAIDLGVQEPPVIIEAKVVLPGAWANSIRQAVGQLYEYRYFQVVPPSSALVFLASVEVPAKWIEYLEADRGIGVAWRTKDSFHVSARAQSALGM